MIEIARSENRPGFERDAHNAAASPAIVVIGVRSNPAAWIAVSAETPLAMNGKSEDGDSAASTLSTWVSLLARRLHSLDEPNTEYVSDRGGKKGRRVCGKDNALPGLELNP